MNDRTVNGVPIDLIKTGQPDARALVKEGGDVLAAAKQCRVQNPEQYQDAGTKLQLIKGLMKKIADTFDPHIQRAHAAHKALVAEKNGALKPLEEAETAYKKAMLRFQLEEEQKRRAEQARLEEQARKEREKLEARAEKAAAKGKDEKATELRVQAQTVATPVIATQTPKVSGISTRETYRATVTNKGKLIEAVAGGRRVFGDPKYAGPERRVHAKVPDAVVNYDQAVLNAQARSLKEALNYPGVKVEIVQTLASAAA